MSEFLQGPDGPVRVSPEQQSLLADAMTSAFRDDEVELTFIKSTETAEDGSVGDVVARIRLPRDSFVTMVDWMQHSVDSRGLRHR